jgi:predicted ATP-grasp superfamily ATP-dependent carboligase
MVAAWPGMGNVAVIAAGYLIRELKIDETGELSAAGHFDINEVSVKDGLITPVRPPRGIICRWTNPGPGRDLIVFIGEAQPNVGPYSYARKLMEVAAAENVERVVTFASMASGLKPGQPPRVFGVATDSQTMAELKRAEVAPLEDGEIGGLNGLVLAAAAEREISGMCLLGEIPFFAATVPNPHAARAALSVFSVLAGIDVSLEELTRHAAAVDQMLVEAYEKMREAGQVEEAEDEEDETPEPAPTSEPAQEAKEPVLEPGAARRIERLFDEAKKNTTKAFALKKELDRLGVFKKYEDRFLDLFRRAG